MLPLLKEKGYVFTALYTKVLKNQRLSIFQSTSITRTLAKSNCFKFRFPSEFDELPGFYCGKNCIAAVVQIKRKAVPVFIEHVLSPT